MNTRKSIRRKKKNKGIFSGYKLRGDYFGRKLIALVSLSVLVMAAGVFAFAEFGGDDCECIEVYHMDMCYGGCMTGNICDICGEDCGGYCQLGYKEETECFWFGPDCLCYDVDCNSYECNECAYGNKFDCHCAPLMECFWPDQNPGGTCYCEDSNRCEICYNGDINDCPCAKICTNCGIECLSGLDCTCDNVGNCPCAGTGRECLTWLQNGMYDRACGCDDPRNCDYCPDDPSCPCASPGEDEPGTVVPPVRCVHSYEADPCGCGDDYYNCHWCINGIECECTQPATPPPPPVPTGEHFRFEVTTTAPGQTFYIPLSGFSGAPDSVLNTRVQDTIITQLNNNTNRRNLHSYDWNISWTDGPAVNSAVYAYDVRTDIGDVRPGQNLAVEGIPIHFTTAGTHTITITPNGSQDKWFAAFGFGYTPYSSAGNNVTNSAGNKGMLTKLVSPITPLMTRAAGNINEILSHEWANAFINCVNITMGPEFTFRPDAWNSVTRVGYGFAWSMFEGVNGSAFTMGESFNLPQNIDTTAQAFAERMFYGCSGAAFNMNSIFNLPPKIRNVASTVTTGKFEFFAVEMFGGCSGDSFTMNADFNLPPGIENVHGCFATRMFDRCGGAAFTMNEVFNFPQGIKGTVGMYFATGMFRGCSGNAFNMNDVFTMPQGITGLVDTPPVPGLEFAGRMFEGCSGDSFTMNAVFNLPQLITVISDSFVSNMFNGCSGDAFTMNNVFTLPPGILVAKNNFALSMFRGCYGENFTMGNAFNLPQTISINSSVDGFAQSMFFNCSGDSFTMNNRFNLPPSITQVGNSFASSMFSGCSGPAFTMNGVFNLPQNITRTGESFASSMFRNCSGASFTMNVNFNLPQSSALTIGDYFAANSFEACNGPSFMINEVFKFPSLSATNLNRTGVFTNTFRNINPGQTRTALSIIGGIATIPNTQRNTFSGNTGSSMTDNTVCCRTHDTDCNDAFSDWNDVTHNWGGPPPGRFVTYVFTGLEGSGFDMASLKNIPTVRLITAAEANPALFISMQNGFPQYYTAIWYDNPAFSGDPFVFSSTTLTRNITLYALDNVAYDHTSAHRTLATSSFGLILVAGEFDLNSTLTVPTGRTVTYDGIKLQGQTVAQPSVIRASNNFRHFTVNGSLTLTANCNITLTRTAERIAGTNQHGGGIAVNIGGSFTMNGGKIDGNSTSSDGGGVAVSAGGNLVINGGEISRNASVSPGNNLIVNGGGVVVDGGSLIMNGGEINDNFTSGGGGGAAILGGGTFEFNGGTISENRVNGSNAIGAGVYVLNGNFDMYDGAVIRDNKAGYSITSGLIYEMCTGGGVFIRSNNIDTPTTFNMHGGEITGNIALNAGGVAVHAQSTGHTYFNMKGNSVISYNQASAYTSATGGGGVLVNADGTNANVKAEFTMSENSKISNNSALKNSEGGPTLHGGGVIVIGANASFILNNGEISENVGSHRGGGVYLRNGTMTMNGGFIKNNEVREEYGAGVHVESGTFTMEAGFITGNISNPARALLGGGVSVSGGSFIMKEGVIADNIAASGGGINLWGGKAEIYGGSITNNTGNNGGGISVLGGSLTITGGSITGNTATVNGGGIFTVNYSSLDIRGGENGVVFSGNTALNAFDFGIHNWGESIVLSSFNSNSGTVPARNVSGNPQNIKWSLTGNGLSNWGTSIPGTHLLNNYDVNYNRTFTITFNGNATGVQNSAGTTWNNTTSRVILNAISDGQGGLKGHGGRIAGINPVMPDNRQEPGDYPTDPNPGFTILAPPVRAGYDFIAWSTEADDYEANGDSLQNEFTAYTRVSSSLTVYAQWKPKPMIPSWPEAIDFGTNQIKRNGFVRMGDGVGFSHGLSDTVIQIQNPANTNWSIVVQAKTKDAIDGGVADPNSWLLASRMYVGETTSIFGAAAPIYVNETLTHAPGSLLNIKWQDLIGGGLMVENGADFQARQYQTILDWNIVFAPFD